jgi:hypothetical protein
MARIAATTVPGQPGEEVYEFEHFARRGQRGDGRSSPHVDGRVARARELMQIIGEATGRPL